MATLTQKRPRIGDECWFVEWCLELAFYDDDPTGDVDRDRCKMIERRVATREDAEQLAREVYPVVTQTYGVVEYWPARFVPYSENDAADYPHVGYWDAIGNSEFYEGE